MVFAVNAGGRHMVSKSPLRQHLKLNKMQLQKFDFINKHDIIFSLAAKTNKPIIKISKKNS